MKRAWRRSGPAAMALCLALGLTGCGGGLQSMEWAIEPTYGFEAVEPVADFASLAEGGLCSGPGEAGYYLVKTAGGWGVLDTATGQTAAEGVFYAPPSRCHLGELYDPSLYEEGRRLTNEEYQQADQELEALGTSFRMESGHGGVTERYLQNPEDGQVYQTRGGDTQPLSVPVRQGENVYPGLLPVQRGQWEENEIMWDGRQLYPQPGSLYAVATPQGELLTGFVYEAACMGTGEMIAVRQNGKWGYVNGEGRLVIPCEYEAFWGARWQWSEAEGRSVCRTGVYPAPATGGCVVLRQNGRTGVAKTDGSWLLEPGEVEDAAPAANGLLWVKTNGKWGALTLN